MVSALAASPLDGKIPARFKHYFAANGLAAPGERKTRRCLCWLWGQRQEPTCWQRFLLADISFPLARVQESERQRQGKEMGVLYSKASEQSGAGGQPRKTLSPPRSVCRGGSYPIPKATRGAGGEDAESKPGR